MKKNRELILVSVCIITYNQEKYIEEAIRGVLSQKGQFKMELIIGDDNSTDNTPLICERYRNEYPEIISFYRNHDNLGLINNYTRTMNKAHGKYIALCPGDDYWIDEFKIQKQISFLEANASFSLSCSNWKNYYQKTDILVDNVESKEGLLACGVSMGEENIQKLLCGKIVGTRDATFCFRRSLYVDFVRKDTVLFTNKEFPCVDLQLVAELLYRGKVHFLEDNTAVYRIQEESASISANQKKMAYFSFGVWKIKLHIWKKYNLSQETIDVFSRGALGGILKYSFLNMDAYLSEQVFAIGKRYLYRFRVSHYLMILASRNKLAHISLVFFLRIYESTTNSKR